MVRSSAFSCVQDLRGDGGALLARVVGERDALVGGAAGIEGVVAPAALHLQHVREGGGEDVLPARRACDVLGARQAEAENAAPREGGDGDGVGLIAAEQDDAVVRHADEKADMAERRIGAAREHGDGADLGRCCAGCPSRDRSAP